MKSVFYTVIHFLLALPARLIFRIRTVGRKNEPRRAEGSYILCANHQTVLDIVFLCAALRRQQPHVMAKAELFRNKFLGWVVGGYGGFPVERGSGDTDSLNTRSCRFRNRNQPLERATVCQKVIHDQHFVISGEKFLGNDDIIFIFMCEGLDLRGVHLAINIDAFCLLCKEDIRERGL